MSEEQIITMPAHGWLPRFYQVPLFEYFENGGKHAVEVLPRRHGKDYSAMNLIALMSQQRKGLYWIVYPQLKQGRQIAWDGMAKDGSKFIDVFPEELITKKHNDDMSLELVNGSRFQVMGADYPDNLRGPNPVGIVYSEYAVMDPEAAKILAPIILENGGWELYIYTPMGNNHGLKKLNYAKAHKNWFWDHRTAADLKVLTPEQLREAREECEDESLFQQEYMCSFEAPLSGAYYAKELAKALEEHRIGKFPINPKYPVHTAWDLGMDDSTSIWFFQIIGRAVYMIHYYEVSGAGLPPCIHYLQEFQKTYGIMYGTHYAPWDIVVRDWTTGKARIDVARELGLQFRIVQKHAIEDGIEAVRNQLPICYFDEVECDRGVDALRSYMKEWEEDKHVFKPKPRHDWASHGADAFRTMAFGLRMPSTGGLKIGEQSLIATMPTHFNIEYDPLAGQ